MTANPRTTLAAVLAAALALGLGACNTSPKTQFHKEQVNAANTRWLRMRSSLMMGMAQQQFDTGDLDQAEKTLKEAYGLDPTNAKVVTLMGRVALERGQLERASRAFEQASTLDPRVPDCHYYQGIIMQRWQRYDQALDQYRRAFDLERDNVSYLLAMTEMMVSTDKVDDAIALLNDKAVYFDQNAAVRVALGQLYLIKHDAARAVAFFQQAMVLKPDDMHVLEQLAGAQMEAGNTDDAVASYERLCHDKTCADRRDLQRMLGEAYLKGDRPAPAKEVFLKLTQSDPGDADAWLRLGSVALTMHDTAGALLAANRVMSLTPHNPDAYVLAAMVWQGRGRLDQALDLLDRAAELAPQNPEPVVLRGIALQRAGRPEAAAAAYTEALRRRPDDARVRALLANIGTDAPTTKQEP